MYWQEPDRIDLALAEPEVQSALAGIDDDALLRLLTPLSSESGAGRGDEPGYLSVSWSGIDRSPKLAATVLAEWHERVTRVVERAKAVRPDDPAAGWSGMWYSIPPSNLIASNGVTASGVPAGLVYTEDGPPSGGVFLTRLEVHANRLYAIDSGADWAWLCESYPLDVTAEVRQDWYRTTGRDGPWVMPNWRAVSRDWDGVLLTRRAYLSAAGTAIPVGNAASVIAGWNPGETYWLTDDISASQPERWYRSLDSGTWMRD